MKHLRLNTNYMDKVKNRLVYHKLYEYNGVI